MADQDCKMSVKVNDFELSLGIPINRDDLKNAGISKVGFFIKSAAEKFKEPGDEIYWIKNPVIECFDHFNVTVIPGGRISNSDVSTDSICGTSCFLYFNQGCLRQVIAQVFSSFTWTHKFIDAFRETANEHLTDPEVSQFSVVPIAPGGRLKEPKYLICRWASGNSRVTTHLFPSGNAALVAWSN